MLKTKNKKNACLIDMTKHTKNCDASADLSEILFPENLEGFSPSRQGFIFLTWQKMLHVEGVKAHSFRDLVRSFCVNLPPPSKGPPLHTPRKRRCGKKTQGFFFAQNQLLKRNDEKLSFSETFGKAPQASPPSEVVGFLTPRSTSSDCRVFRWKNFPHFIELQQVAMLN